MAKEATSDLSSQRAPLNPARRVVKPLFVLAAVFAVAAVGAPQIADAASSARVASVRAAGGAMEEVARQVHQKAMSSNVTVARVANIDVRIHNRHARADANFLAAAGFDQSDYLLLAAPQETATTPSTVEGEVAVVPRSVQGTERAKQCYAKFSNTGKNGAPSMVVVTSSC